MQKIIDKLRRYGECQHDFEDKGKYGYCTIAIWRHLGKYYTIYRNSLWVEQQPSIFPTLKSLEKYLGQKDRGLTRAKKSL